MMNFPNNFPMMKDSTLISTPLLGIHEVWFFQVHQQVLSKKTAACFNLSEHHGEITRKSKEHHRKIIGQLLGNYGIRWAFFMEICLNNRFKSSGELFCFDLI